MRNVEGVQAATEHLLGQGRRRVVAFGSNPCTESGSAASDWRDTARDSGRRCPTTQPSSSTWSAGSTAPGHRHAQLPRQRHPLRRRGGIQRPHRPRRHAGPAGGRPPIPHDVAVIGFDDIDEARYSLPSLSTIDPGREEIAEVAVRYLKQRIASDADVPPREHLI